MLAKPPVASGVSAFPGSLHVFHPHNQSLRPPSEPRATGITTPGCWPVSITWRAAQIAGKAQQFNKIW